MDSNTNRPLKDVIISHCDQLEIVTSMFNDLSNEHFSQFIFDFRK